MTATTTTPSRWSGAVSASAWTMVMTVWHLVHLAGAVVVAVVVQRSDEPSGALAAGRRLRRSPLLT